MSVEAMTGNPAGQTRAGAPVGASASVEAGSVLSRSQRLIWTGQQLNPGVPLYNMAFRFDMEGELDVALFQTAFQALVDRCDALRTVFVEDGGVPRQVVLPTLAYRPELVDLTGAPEPMHSVRNWVEERSRRCFDLAACSFDSDLLKVGDTRFVWYLNQHHLTTDAWSTTLIYRHLGHLYASLRKAGKLKSEAMPAYADYLAHERRTRESTTYAAAVKHWEEVSARPAPRAILYGCSPTVRGPRTERVSCDLGPERTARLRALALEPGIRSLSVDLTLFNLLSAVLFAYLWRVSGNAIQVLGAPAHNRSSLAFRETVGLFIELFPLRTEVDEDETFRSLLSKVSAESQQYLRHAVPGSSSPAGMRTFSVVFNYIHAVFEPFDGLPTNPEWIHVGSGDPEHDLRLQVHDFADRGSLCACFDLNCSTFPDAFRERVPGHFLRVLDACLADTGVVLGRIGLATDEEQAWLVEGLNPRAVLPGATGSVVSLFRSQAARTPDAVALRVGGETVSYGELDQRSDRLASLLRGRGVEVGSLVGILMERSLEMVLGLLAVLKAGAGYVPLDWRLPDRRLRFIVGDTGMRLVLTQGAGEARLPADQVEVLPVDAVVNRSPAGQDELPPIGSGDVAYVMYTSGSTGVPKGVVVEHGGLADYVLWAREAFSANATPIYPLYSSIGFDLTVTSIFVPLICGGSIVVYPETEENTDLAILRVFDEDRVDTVKLTPAHLRLVADRDMRDSRVRTLILGGEDLKSPLARRVDAASEGRVAVFNEYGPTEGIVGCMVHRFNPEADDGPSVPIGVPADGVRIYVLDDGLNPVPRGVTGELFIGGARLARGYLDLGELTAERFLPDPFVPGGRMYRTGDLARIGARGLLEYLGRNDEQVKIRGVRVEPAEVEQALLEHPEVDACVLGVSRVERRDTWENLRYCVRCGLPSNHPTARIDDDGVCNLCAEYEDYRERAKTYFSSMNALRAIIERARPRVGGRYECLVLLSGGKDSTYALYQVASMTRRILAVTLDNGYISDGAKANIARVVDSLGVDHRFLRTPAMNAIFVDSLERHSNVCHGCFKTLYTLATQTALQEGIPLIVTGLSRGQFFETRLTPELFRETGFDVEAIDRTVLEARKAYHRLDDAVSRLLDVEMFEDDQVFERVEFVDFYRYCDATLEEMYAFLAKHAPWIRPGDTGRSTNCLINDVGIHVHKHKEGYHNYALPYSWDVRLGHKNREEALEELDDRIDVEKVQRILREIGCEEDVGTTEAGDSRLVAYFTSPRKQSNAALRAFLAERLPLSMMPSGFVQLEAIPLTPNGKVDREALPDLRAGHPPIDEVYRAPRDGMESQLAGIWRAVLRVQRVGATDNFFDLGGDSIAAIQIVAKANEAGIGLTARDMFQHQTVTALAGVAQTVMVARADKPAAGSDFPLANLDQKGMDKLAALLKGS